MSDYVLGSTNQNTESQTRSTDDQTVKKTLQTPSQLSNILSKSASLHDNDGICADPAQKSDKMNQDQVVTDLLKSKLQEESNVTKLPLDLFTDELSASDDTDTFSAQTYNEVSEAQKKTANQHADQRLFSHVIKTKQADEKVSPKDSTKKFSPYKKIKLSSQILLFLRQILASFFTHTNLGAIMPKTATYLGPCYPSSMPIPYFVVGFISTFPFFYGLTFIMQVPHLLLGALSVTAFFMLNGICGFHGIAKICASFSNSRTTQDLHSVISVLYVIVLVTCLETLREVCNQDLYRPPLFFASCCMLSALSGCSLSLGLTADPVNSFGSLSIKGLAFSSVITATAMYCTFPPLVATSLIGIALLLRLLLGIYMNQKTLLISRSIVCASQLIVLPALLIYVIIATARNII